MSCRRSSWALEDHDPERRAEPSRENLRKPPHRLGSEEVSGKGEELTAAKLAAYESPTALVNTVDLEAALCQVDTNCGWLGYGWLLYTG